MQGFSHSPATGDLTRRCRPRYSRSAARGLSTPQGRKRGKIYRPRAKLSGRNHQGSEKFLSTDISSEKRVYSEAQENCDIWSRKYPQESCCDFAFPVLPLLTLFPAQRRVALFLPSSCSCFSMPLALRYLCTGATDPSGWGWSGVFFLGVSSSA